MLSNKAKRKRINAKNEESTSTNSSLDNDQSHIQQLHTSIDRHNIELLEIFNDQHSDGFLCNESIHSELSSQNSEHSFHSQDSEYCELSHLEF